MRDDADGVSDAADPQCIAKPWRDRERRDGCGLGSEVLVTLSPLRARRPVRATTNAGST